MTGGERTKEREMALSPKILKMLNEQITKEFHSSYLYLQMAAWFAGKNFTGFENYMRVQAQEEASHAMILFNYVLERGGDVVLGAVEAPCPDFKSVLEIFEKAYAHEQYITKSIHDIVEAAQAEKDHATALRLDWFVEEQVEEEAGASALVEKLKMVGSENRALFWVDKELKKREFHVPSPLAKG
jgi:ferritin